MARALPEFGGDHLEVGDEALVGRLARLVVAGAQDRGRVHGDHDHGRELGLERLAAGLGDLDVAPHERLRRHRTETDEHARLDHGELGLQPRAAGVDVLRARALMDAALAALLEVEVLDRVGDVDERAVDPGLDERLVEDPARRADERMTLAVLAVAGLLADEHRLGLRRPLAEDRLRRALVELAGATGLYGLAHAGQRRAVGDGRAHLVTKLTLPLVSSTA